MLNRYRFTSLSGRWYSRIGQYTSRRAAPLAVAFILVAGMGVRLLGGTHAAAFVSAREAESGALGGAASIFTDATASEGKAVKFGSSVSASVAFTVVGNKIENSSGQQVLLHGVDRPSLEWSCTGTNVNGVDSGIPASDFTTMRKTWNADAVRIALSEDRWLPGTKDYCSGYQNTVKTAVQDARAAGLIVILDLHWSDQGSNSTTSGQ